MSRESSNLADQLKDYIKTAELFGEEYFSSGKVDSKVSENSGSACDQELQALYLKFSDCRKCALGKTRKKIVFGMGSIHPKVLFVGEGPGYEEDRKGFPFVGRAGELLDNILKSIELDRKTVYITNIVKCHPLRDASNPEMRGNDRPPEDAEIKSCREILNHQIEILKPSVICALGSVAAKTLLNTTEGITRLRGRVHDFSYPSSDRVIPLVPTYHPAALLRDELLKKETWEDMKLLKELIRQKSTVP